MYKVVRQGSKMNNDWIGVIPSEAEKHELIGNALCLDYANTLYGHASPRHEYLLNYLDLVIWSQKAGILQEQDAKALIRIAHRHPKDALAIFHGAIAFRETLYRIFATIAHGSSPNSGDVSALNAARTQALLHTRINRSARSFVIDWDDTRALDRMLWVIAISAGELLASENLDRIRQCSGSTCDWLFLDTSRNQMRRWCSMSKCGNRSKVRRFLQRRRKHAHSSSRD